jgi:molybdopterin-binding protein
MVIDVSAGKGSVVASRISRISANEIHFKTANQQEIGVSFAEISQVTLRHKDATH